VHPAVYSIVITIVITLEYTVVYTVVNVKILEYKIYSFFLKYSIGFFLRDGDMSIEISSTVSQMFKNDHI